MPHICVYIRLKIIHQIQTKVKYYKYKVVHNMNAMNNQVGGGSDSLRSDKIGLSRPRREFLTIRNI